MDKYVEYCKQHCRKNITLEKIMNDTTKCNFCDVAYYIIEDMDNSNRIN